MFRNMLNKNDYEFKQLAPLDELEPDAWSFNLIRYGLNWYEMKDHIKQFVRDWLELHHVYVSLDEIIISTKDKSLRVGDRVIYFVVPILRSDHINVVVKSPMNLLPQANDNKQQIFD